MYRHVDAGLVRLSTHDSELAAVGCPDLDGSGADGTRSRCEWLRRAWGVGSFADAVAQASPVLAERVEAVITADSPCPRVVHRATVSVLRYLLRATTRATPFGLFAGVAPARVTPRTEVRLGAAHRVIARADPRWLAELIEQVQRVSEVRDRLPVTANELAVPRGDRLVLPCPHHIASAAEISVRMTRPVVLAVHSARHPIRFAALRDAVLDEVPAAQPAAVEQMLATLVAEGFLVTELTATLSGADPLNHVIDVITRLDRSSATAVDPALAQLRAAARARLDRGQAPTRPATEAPADGGPRPLTNLDVRVDAAISVPPTVMVEAENAAAALVRTASEDPGRVGWRDYHRRFLDRYGIGALVPVLELLHGGDGLGYPTGFRHSTLPAPRDSDQTRRVAHLIALAQAATRNRQREVVLTDADLDRLGSTATAPAQPHTDLRAEVHAASRDDLDSGEFRLVVIGASRAAGTVTGRFLDLLDPDDQDRIIETYRGLPGATRGAERIQLRGVPLNLSAAAITHSPSVLSRHVVVGGGTHPSSDSPRLELSDIAVSADAAGLCLVSLTDRTPLEAHLFSAVELVVTAHPTLRFLTEIATSSCAPCAPFVWGRSCAMLPFLPRLRYGRTILSSARWILTTDDLTRTVPTDGDAVASGPTNDLLAWQRRWDVPDRVELREHDRRLGLDLREPAHRHLLRAALRRSGRVTVADAPEPGMLGWIEGRAHELVIALAATSTPTHPPRPRPTAALVTTANPSARQAPGTGDWLSAHLPCLPDQQTAVLTRHIPALLGELDLIEDGWWFLRHTDNGHHLRIRIRLNDPDAYGSTAVRVGRWADALVRTGITGPPQLHPYRPELGRFGDGPLMHAGEAVFAADSAAALAQLDLGDSEPRAVTAAGLLAIATQFLPGDGLTWLRDHAPRTGTARLDPAVRARTITLAAQQSSALAPVTDGDPVMAAWVRREAALRRYRLALTARGIDAQVVLPDLLHLHHTRVAALDVDAERDCLRLARAAALSLLARTGHAA